MNTKMFLFLCVFAAIIGIAIGVYSFGRASQSPPQNTGDSASNPVAGAPTLAEGALVDEETLPAPVIPSVPATIASVSDGMIVINGPEGEMTLPKDPAVVTVLRRTGDQTVVATLDDVDVGMSVEVDIIKPGEKVNLILL